MKKVISIILMAILCVNMFITQVVAETNDIGNFKATNNYIDGQFEDVLTTDWFYENIKTSFEIGLMKGINESHFNPTGNITIAESIVLACRIHSIYNKGVAEFPQTKPWYDAYVKYAFDNNIINSQYSDFDAQATRAQFASILANALPNDELFPINNIRIGDIPDVKANHAFVEPIYKLYNAGIITGNDEYGTFTPEESIERAAAAAIATRMVNLSLRKNVKIRSKESNYNMTAEQIANKFANAVFCIESYGLNGELKGTGSGFFISADGIAITNHHVIANSLHFEITTTNGKSYDNIKIIDVDKDNDLAMLKVEGNDFDCVVIGDSNTVEQGQSVYAIGSPMGLENTISQGIISNAKRNIGGVEYIQISVPINHGSSGGALFDTSGKVIGVTSAGMDATGDLNFAIPINKINNLNHNSKEELITWEDVYYPSYSTVLDFGAFSGVDSVSEEREVLTLHTWYDLSDFHSVGNYTDADCFAYTIDAYCTALEEKGMILKEKGDFFIEYISEKERVVIIFGFENDVITIAVNRVLKYYDNFPRLVDFECFSLLPANDESYYDDNGTVFGYTYKDVYSEEEFKEIVDAYFNWIEMDEFKYLEYKDGNYYFMGNGMYLYFSFFEKGKFLVGIYTP